MPTTSTTRVAIVFLLSFLLTLALQYRGNAYQSEWSGDPDEPAHYVTGLMFHDYIAQGFPGRPLAYAQKYYDVYPKVALGHWPPVFYIIQAAWTLIFTPSRISLLMLMAVLGASWLTASYVMIASQCPQWMACISVVLLASTYDYQMSSRMIMAEVVVALLTLFALRSLARYLDEQSWPDVLRFSGWSLAAVLTKGTGIALAPMLFLGAIVGRRWRLLRSTSFWFAPLLVAIVAAAWFLAAPDGLHQKVISFAGFGAPRWVRLGSSLDYLVFSLGLAACLLALAGLLRKSWSVATNTERRGLWILVVIFMPVTYVCRLLIGPWEARHLITTFPLLLLCMWEAISWILSIIPRFRTAALAVIVAILMVNAVRSVLHMPPKVHLGLDLVAQELVTEPTFKHDRFLILSDGNGEGVFIAEVAAREKRLGHVVERGTKVLADVSFMGDRAREFYKTPAEMMLFFEQVPDRIVILDGVETASYLSMARQTVLAYPGRWQHLKTYPRANAKYPVEVLRLNPQR